MAKQAKRQRKAGAGRKRLPAENKKSVYIGVYTTPKNIESNFGSKEKAAELIDKIINK